MPPESDFYDIRRETPVSTYLRYLRARHAWEQKTWKLGGPSGPRFLELLEELDGIHNRLSTNRPLTARDRSVVWPAPRDPKTVTVASVTKTAADEAVIGTFEAEIDPAFPTRYEVRTRLVDGEWRLVSRTAVHGRERIELL